MGNLFLAMEIDYGMSSFIARNKLPTLWPNSYLHTQASEIQVATKWSKQLSDAVIKDILAVDHRGGPSASAISWQFIGQYWQPYSS